MKFNFECEDLDGLVIMDKAYIDELDNETLYDFDICLDRKGKSELIYDFPNEKWEDVYSRAFHSIERFCADGKMILFLLHENSYDCNIDIVNESFVTDSFLDIKSGNVLVVSAGELIQCAAYKELDMETILELSNIKKGKYAIKKNDISNIVLSSVNTTPTVVHNIVCF